MPPTETGLAVGAIYGEDHCRSKYPHGWRICDRLIVFLPVSRLEA